VADPIGTIRDLVEDLSAAHAMWGWRDDSKAQPQVRGAANTAMDSIDGLLHELHQLRAAMVTEIRRYDDATAARVDALLEKRRGDGRG
jgi:thiamine monophosphate kinase